MREPARRVLSKEYNNSHVKIREGNSQYAPKYIVTPTGAKCNRVFIVGVATDVENIGQDGDFYRLIVSDPVGEFYLYSGQYQPDATRKIANLDPPEYVAISAKVDSYENDEGELIASLNPENVTKVSGEERDMWNVTTAERTLERLEQADNAPEVAIDNYGPVDVDRYARLVRKALSPITDVEVEEPKPVEETPDEGQGGEELDEEGKTWDFSE